MKVNKYSGVVKYMHTLSPHSSTRIQLQHLLNLERKYQKEKWWYRGFYLFFFLFGVYIGLGLTY